MATPKFEYNYKGLNYKDAEKQVSSQVNPVYNKAIDSVQQQKYKNDVQSGQVAAARGLGRSGLAADAINKNAIAAQGQIGDLSAQRASQISQMANDLLQRDKDRGMQSRSQAYSEWMGQQNLQRDDRNFDYQKEMNTSDKQWREYAFNNMSASEKAQLEWAKQTYGEDAAWRMYELEYNGELQKSMSDAEREFYSSLGLGDFLP